MDEGQRRGKLQLFILLFLVGFLCLGCILSLILMPGPPTTEQLDMQDTQSAVQITRETDSVQATEFVVEETQNASQATQTSIQLTQTVQAAGTISADLTRQYFDIPHLQDASSEVTAYIAGKVIIIDISPPIVVDSIVSAALPQQIIAHTPDEVGTIIWIACKNKNVGFYTDDAPAYQIACDVTVIDKSKSLIVGKQTFLGSSPPQSKTVSGPEFGAAPTDQIVQYINSLPTQ